MRQRRGPCVRRSSMLAMDAKAPGGTVQDGEALGGRSSGYHGGFDACSLQRLVLLLQERGEGCNSRGSGTT